ncbi:MAG: hypothetical protein JNM86_13335 [Phycisphaerae bacterium]|nr:hypothetical protein [Phycisphaerae bacterium]
MPDYSHDLAPGDPTPDWPHKIIAIREAGAWKLKTRRRSSFACGPDEWDAEFGTLAQEGDEIWDFESPDALNRAMCFRAGFSLMRNNVVVLAVCTAIG